VELCGSGRVGVSCGIFRGESAGERGVGDGGVLAVGASSRCRAGRLPSLLGGRLAMLRCIVM